MKIFGTVRLAVALWLLTSPMVSTVGQNVQPLLASGADSKALRMGVTRPVARTAPASSFGSREFTYSGVFSADAIFHPSSKLTGVFDAERTADDVARQTAVPPRMLPSSVRVIEDVAPPAHAIAVAHPHSVFGGALGAVVGFVYGRRAVLQSPSEVTTDSRQRLVVSDPTLRAVHVLDPRGKTSFTILGGEGRRLQLPGGVAVDREDNIYVVDSGRGMLLVYDREGRFLRYIGNFHGENWYQYPTALAIDRKAGHLFVADTPRNLIFMMDLEGTVLRRIGKYRGSESGVEFDSPNQIAVNGIEIVVLDAQGSRVQILNLQGDLTGSFKTRDAFSRQKGKDAGGMAADKEGNIYVSDVADSVVRIYRPDGRQVAILGKNGRRAGEFDGPNGLWIDEQDRMYVADAANARVQLFQLGGADSEAEKNLASR